MKKRMTVSEARAKLFDLVEYVTDTPDAAVVIEHRNRKERAVLVDESHFQYLEAVAREMRKQAPPFRLEGSLQPLDGSEVDLVDVVERNRRRQADLSRRKLGEILGDD